MAKRIPITRIPSGSYSRRRPMILNDTLSRKNASGFILKAGIVERTTISRTFGYGGDVTGEVRESAGRELGSSLRMKLPVSLSTRMKEEVNALILRHWAGYVENTRRRVIMAVLKQRSGGLLANSKILVTADENNLTSGVASGASKIMNLDFNIKLSLTGAAKMYGGVQEYGRGTRGKRKSKYYMVPIAQEFRNKAFRTEDFEKYLGSAGNKKDNILWSKPGRDSDGRIVRYVIRLRPELADWYKKVRDRRTRYAAGISRARRALKENAREAQALDAIERGKRPKFSRAMGLKAWGEILFLAYPKGITSIPGKSKAFSRENRATGADVYNSPWAVKAGFGPGGGAKGRGPGEASRWFTRTMVISARHLDSIVRNTLSGNSAKVKKIMAESLDEIGEQVSGSLSRALELKRLMAGQSRDKGNQKFSWE